MTQIRIPPISGTSPAELQQWARQVSQAVEKSLIRLPLDITMAPMRSYEVENLPDATGPKRWIYVSDESGGAVPAFNDGTDWRRATDRAVVS